MAVVASPLLVPTGFSFDYCSFLVVEALVAGARFALDDSGDELLFQYPRRGVFANARGQTGMLLLLLLLLWK